VELDGKTWRILPAEPVLRAGLSAGLELDRDRARRLRHELRRAEGLAVAARALRARDLSAQRLRERLERKSVAGRERDAVVDTAVSAGLVDDERFARRRAAVLAERGYGNDAIAADLERQGISPELRQDVIEALGSESERAAEIVRRRGATPRTARFLASRGFGLDVLEAAVGVRFANGA
jgi:SOS response regulatory protein OraA/RecX